MLLRFHNGLAQTLDTDLLQLPQRTLLILCCIAVVVAGAAGFYVVNRSAPDAAQLRLYVDIGLLLTLILIVVGTTGSKTHLLRDLAEAVRGLSIGSYRRRLNPAEFGPLEDVARAFNEAAASLSENDDPNLGPVKSKPRPDQALSVARKKNDSEHPELGEVRKIGTSKTAEERPKSDKSQKSPKKLKKQKKQAKRGSDRKSSENPSAEARSSKIDGASGVGEAKPIASPKRDSAADSVVHATPQAQAVDEDAPTILEPASALNPSGEATEDAPRDEGAINQVEAAAPNPNTAHAEQPPATEPPEPEPPATEQEPPATEQEKGSTETGKSTSSSDVKLPIIPTRKELKHLFETFVAEKKKVKEDTSDLEFQSFAETLEDESRRLVQDHGCRGIRFEITIDGGEVSLLPHLLR